MYIIRAVYLQQGEKTNATYLNQVKEKKKIKRTPMVLKPFLSWSYNDWSKYEAGLWKNSDPTGNRKQRFL